MPQGVPVGRQWVLTSPDGEVIIDWGGGLYQNVHDGNFFEVEKEMADAILITDEQLVFLKSNGKISSFDAQIVYFLNLPDRFIPTID